MRLQLSTLLECRATRLNFCVAKFSSFVVFEQLKTPVIAPSSSALRKPAAARSSASSQLAGRSSPCHERAAGSAVVPRSHAPESRSGRARRSCGGAGRPRPSAPTRARARRAPVRAGRAGPGRAARAARIVERRARAPRPRASRRGGAGARVSPGRARRARRLVEPARARQRARGAVEAAHAELFQRVEGDAPVGRQLAAGDAQHPGRPVEYTVSRRALAVPPGAAGQHAQPAEGGAHRAESRTASPASASIVRRRRPSPSRPPARPRAPCRSSRAAAFPPTGRRS